MEEELVLGEELSRLPAHAQDLLEVFLSSVLFDFMEAPVASKITFLNADDEGVGHCLVDHRLEFYFLAVILPEKGQVPLLHQVDFSIAAGFH